MSAKSGRREVGDRNGVAYFVNEGGLHEYGAPVRKAVTGTTASHALPTFGVVREMYIHSTVRTLFATGASGAVMATVGDGSHIVEAGEKFYFRAPVGHTHIALLGVGGTGDATLAPLA